MDGWFENGIESGVNVFIGRFISIIVILILFFESIDEKFFSFL